MTWADLPVKLKVYIVFLAALAIPIALWTVWDLISNQHNTGWLVLTAYALATVIFFLRLPSVNATIGIGDAYIMAIAMMYGVSPCIAATFFHTILISILAPRPKIYSYRVVFNTSSMICGAWFYSTIYHTMNHGSARLQDIVIPSFVLVLSYFFINSFLTSTAIAWSAGESIITFWMKTCMPLAVDFSISFIAATSIAALHSFNEYVPLFAALLVGFVWGWTKLNIKRAVEAEKHLEEQEKLYVRTVESLALAVDAKDQTTYGHIRRVRAYAMGLAKLCGIKDPSEELRAIETGSLLHDIGKLAIDDYILNKPGRLSKREFEKIKMHTTAGDEILQQIRFPFPVAKFVRYHHEQWDGLGYPDGLKGEEIPLGARILAVSDAYDAIRFSRPYKPSIGTDESVELLRAQGGTIYDPNLVRLFLDNVEELEKTAQKESDNVPELSFRKSFETVDQALLTEDGTSAPSPAKPSDFRAELIHFAELCNIIAGPIDLNDILMIVSRRIEQLVPFTTCVFYIDDEKDYVKAISASGRFSEILQGHSIHMGKGISGWVAAYKRPMVNTNPALDFQGISYDLSFLADALVVPILFEDESLGAISLYAHEPNFYTQEHLNTLQILSGFLAPLMSKAINIETSTSENFIDPDTQIHRIAYLAAMGPQAISFSEKNHSPLSLVFLEVRNLYQIIRLYGADVGKSILRKISDSIKPELRETDIIVRYGHQGFVVLLPGVREDQALHCVQRLKRQIKGGLSTALSGHSLLIDYRAGVASYPKDGTTVFALLQSAQENTKAIASDIALIDNIVEFFPRA